MSAGSSSTKHEEIVVEISILPVIPGQPLYMWFVRREIPREHDINGVSRMNKM